jgi:hypothetical protein
VIALSLLSTIAALLAASPGEISAILLLFAVAVVVILIIDDDDLPGPRLCRIAAT